MNSGQVRIEFHHFAFLGNDSDIAAQAAECAAQQGLFREFYDALFEEWGVDAFGSVNNKRIAAEIGVHTNTFNKCLDQERVQKYVDSDIAMGVSMGVRATPFIFINGRPIQGLHDIADYEQIIDEELNRVGRAVSRSLESGGEECPSGEADLGCE